MAERTLTDVGKKTYEIVKALIPKMTIIEQAQFVAYCEGLTAREDRMVEKLENRDE